MASSTNLQILCDCGFFRRNSRTRVMGPQPETWIGDKEDLLSLNLVVAMRQLVGVVALQHLVQFAIIEAHALDLLAAELSRAPGSPEPSLRRGVNQMRRRTQFCGKVGIGLDG